MSEDVRVTGEVLPRRVGLPTLMLDTEERNFALSETGEWSVESYYQGKLDWGSNAAREGDTGETTEWMVYPSFSRGIGMSVDLLRGQSARISRVNDNTLKVIIIDGDEIVMDSTYYGVILVVREMTARPVDMSNVSEGTFL